MGASRWAPLGMGLAMGTAGHKASGWERMSRPQPQHRSVLAWLSSPEALKPSTMNPETLTPGPSTGAHPVLLRLLGQALGAAPA
jgi:hypothetical protein